MGGFLKTIEKINGTSNPQTRIWDERPRARRISLRGSEKRMVMRVEIAREILPFIILPLSITFPMSEERVIADTFNIESRVEITAEKIARKAIVLKA